MWWIQPMPSSTTPKLSSKGQTRQTRREMRILLHPMSNMPARDSGNA
jgi:hypothetical protein